MLRTLLKQGWLPVESTEIGPEGPQLPDLTLPDEYRRIGYMVARESGQGYRHFGDPD